MHSPDSNGGRLPQRKISGIFLSEGMVAQEQLDEACELQKTDDRPIGKVLISLGYLTYEDLALALAKCLNMAYSKLTETEVVPDTRTPTVDHLVSCLR